MSLQLSTVAPMALVIPNGFAQVLHRMSLIGDPDEMVVTLGLDVSGISDFPALAVDLNDDFIANLGGANMNAAYAYEGCKLYVGQPSGPPMVVEQDIHTPGTYTTAGALPQNVAFLVKKQTALGGRAYRGRFYLPPAFVDELSINATGNILTAAYNILDGKVAAWLAPRLGDWVLLHDTTSPASSPTVITNFALDAVVATQRRRLRR